MTHDEAMEAATYACFHDREAAEAAVNAYLSAFGVRDLAGLVEAARKAGFAASWHGYDAVADNVTAALCPMETTE